MSCCPVFNDSLLWGLSLELTYSHLWACSLDLQRYPESSVSRNHQHLQWVSSLELTVAYIDFHKGGGHTWWKNFVRGGVVYGGTWCDLSVAFLETRNEDVSTMSFTFFIGPTILFLRKEVYITHKKKLFPPSQTNKSVENTKGVGERAQRASPIIGP